MKAYERATIMFIFLNEGYLSSFWYYPLGNTLLRWLSAGVCFMGRPFGSVERAGNKQKACVIYIGNEAVFFETLFSNRGDIKVRWY